MNWKAHAEGPKPIVKEVGGYRMIEVPLPLAKQPELPDDAPGRFSLPQMLAATTFTDWADVSRTMAPLYIAKDMIAPGSALAGEVAKITAAESDPLRRTVAALRLVQDQIRYLAMGMDGGNYTPEKPARTWELRYGDCKAKSLLLLAILGAMNIEAEAVLANIEQGDAVPQRLPTPSAFNHVLVRATVDGRTLWLDGTSSGARLEDIADTPWFRHVLPLRTAGAELIPVEMRPAARAETTTTIEIDQSAGFDLPGLFKIEARVRGQRAAMLATLNSQATAEQRRDLVRAMTTGYLGDAQLSEASIKVDPASGVTTLSASGVANSRWRRTEGRYRMTFDRAVEQMRFEPDRSRAAWRDIPVATGEPSSEDFKLRVKLPAGSTGFALQGDETFTQTLVGRTITRTARIEGDVAMLDERIDALGTEIVPTAIGAERAKMALAKSRLLRVIAPTEVRYRWDSAQAAARDGRYKPYEAVYAKAIADDPEEVTGYESRMSFRLGTYDRKGALEDLTRLLAIESTAAGYLRRASVYEALNQDAKAQADILEARKLDPGSDQALIAEANFKADAKDVKGALAMLDERIALGGEERFSAIMAKADVQADSGDAAGGIATLDAALAEKPGDTRLLNARCWLKGTRNLALESALKDCTKAIELAESPAAALDSRAMVYFRMNRLDDALVDLNAALEIAPGSAGTRYMRAVIAKQKPGVGAGANDLATARLIAPRIDREYSRYGIVP